MAMNEYAWCSRTCACARDHGHCMYLKSNGVKGCTRNVRFGGILPAVQTWARLEVRGNVIVGSTFTHSFIHSLIHSFTHSFFLSFSLSFFLPSPPHPRATARAREADDCAAGVRAPVRCEETRERRDEEDAVRGVDLGRQLLHLGSGRDDREVVAQPSHPRAGNRNSSLSCVARWGGCQGRRSGSRCTSACHIP